MARIIFADDDPIVGQIVSDALHAAGHAVGWVQDGAAAVRAVRFRVPDLVILDCSMPDLSGVGALSQIRNSPHAFNVPVLMLTARGSDTDETIARHAGADDYVRKPCDLDDLLFRIDQLLKYASKQKALGAR